MKRIGLQLLGGLLTATSAFAANYHYYDPDEVFGVRYGEYFNSLQILHDIPEACANKYSTYGSGIDDRCAAAADFNGDGTPDYVALLEYVGGKSRVRDSYIDLILMYTNPETGAIEHEIYSHVGTVNEKGEISVKLEVQPPGDILLPTGLFRLLQPGINLLSTAGDNVDPWFYPTYIWNNRTNGFASVDKSQE